MIQTETLKNFVREHESRLNEKLRDLDAVRSDRVSHRDRQMKSSARVVSGAAQHWNESDMDRDSRRRPHSSYFNFILTSAS